jgi:hypothetical protein
MPSRRSNGLLWRQFLEFKKLTGVVILHCHLWTRGKLINIKDLDALMCDLSLHALKKQGMPILLEGFRI